MLVVALLLATAQPVAAQPAADQQWPQFRGPAGRAIADGAELPDSWAADENVTWAVTIGGTGWSSPIVWEDRVYLTSAITQGEYMVPEPGIFGNDLFTELMEQGLTQDEAMAQVSAHDVEITTDESPPGRWMLYCLDAATGRMLWFRELHRDQAPGGRHRKNSYASETPVTDGEYLYVHIGNVGLFVTSLAGEPVWSTRFDPYPIYLDFGTASSVAIDDELVYVLNDNLTRPYLSAYGKGSGIEVWTVERQAPEGFFPSGWSTPYV